MTQLMIVAHPDDEVLFGLYDLVTHHPTVVCMTNGENHIRRQEFKSVMNALQCENSMLNYFDSPHDQWTEKDEDIVKHILSVTGTDFTAVISHSEDGDGGQHLQHKRCHEISKLISQTLCVPFYTFLKRFQAFDNAHLLDTKRKLGELYVSQKNLIDVYFNYYQH